MARTFDPIKLDVYQYENQLNRWQGAPVRYNTITLDVPIGSVSGSEGEVARYIYVGTTGDVSVVKLDGTTVVIPDMAGGYWHPLVFVQVNTAGTDASGLLWGS